MAESTDPFARVPSNQAPPLAGHNTVYGDEALLTAVRAQAGEGADEILGSLRSLGAVAGSAEAREHGMLANQHEPVFRPVDRFGTRVDEVDFHPSWHWMLRQGVGFGLTGAPWTSEQPMPHVRRAAAYIAWICANVSLVASMGKMPSVSPAATTRGLGAIKPARSPISKKRRIFGTKLQAQRCMGSPL